LLESADEKEFAELLLEWGLLNKPELDEALRLHGTASRNGMAHPAFTDTLIKYGFLTPRQVAEAKSADVKGVFLCAACGVGFEVRISAKERIYKCPRCQGSLERESGTRPAQAAPPAALVTDTVPVDVQVAMHNPEARFGKFVVISEVGRGGAAVIKKAWDSEERCYVALKFLRTPPGAQADPEKIADLMREGERAVHLRHPNIIQIYEMGYIAKQYYLAMEYLEGFTLADLIKSARGRSKVSPFYEDPQRYLTMVRDVARAVHYAHARTPPLIHCDLKPANVFIELSWRPYVLDFGVAREIGPATAEEEEVGTLKGSPAYMAPEQVLAKPDEIDARTDVYGLGAILYDLLTGRPPFTGDLQEVLDKNLLVSPPKPSEVLKARGEISGGTARVYRVPPEVEEICVKCLEKEKKDRYASAKDVAEAITRVIRARPVTQAQQPKTRTLVMAEEAAPAPMAEVRQALASSRVKSAAVVAVIAAGVAAAAILGYGAWVQRPMEASPTDRLQAEADAVAATLAIEAAEARYRRHEELHHDRAAQEWVQARLEDLEAMREMRAGLIVHLTTTQPVIRDLKLRGRALREARVVRASEQVIEVAGDQGREEIGWAQLDPKQLVALATADPKLSLKGKLGLASYAVKNGLAMEAGTLLQQLKGKVPEPRTREIEERLKKLIPQE